MRFFTAALASLLAFGAPKTAFVHVGGTTVHLLQTTGAPGPSFLHLHEDERTATDVTRAFVLAQGGALLEVVCQGKRRITFNSAGETYSFDPNRIFTDVGIEKTLGSKDAAAVHAVDLLRDSIIANLKLSGGPIVAVHNNRDMSVDSYRKGHPLANEARDVSRNQNGSPHDFFLVLDDKLFRQLESLGFNVVLQSLTPTDDGSFSVYAQNTGLRYVNVEALEGHAAEQKHMLEALVPLLNTH